MIARLAAAIDRAERRLRARYNVAPDSPGNARRARIYNLFFDHEILRILWTNEAEIAPGVFRSNHPTRARMQRLTARGITRIINLRGENGSAHFLTEKALCAELGIALHSVALNARGAPSRTALLTLIDLFRTVEKPFLMHCKSGADRAGLAAAIYLLVIEGAPLAQAQKMLSWRYLHLSRSKTGVLDALLQEYGRHVAAAPVTFEDWLREHYDPAQLQARFDARHR